MENTQEDTTLPDTTMTEVQPQQTQSPTTETVAASQTATAIPFYKNRKYIISLVLSLAILLGAGYYAYLEYYMNGGVVARVNGKNIYKTELMESIGLIEQSATASGIDTKTDDAQKEIKNQAINVLVNNALIITGAEKAGFVANDADIQKKYDELVTQVGSAEVLATRMSEIGLTEAKLRKNIADRIVADQYIEAETPIKNVSVTEEEFQKFLETVKKTNPDLPPVEEIRPQIETQIRNQKQQAIIADFIEKLRVDSSVTLK